MMRNVLFDLDGTIVDTNELIIESFLHVLNDKLAMQINREELIPLMGGPLVDQFQYFTGRTNVDQQVADYREYNLMRHDEMVSVFPNVNEVVQAFAKQGIKMGVVTTKMRDTTMRVLQMFDLLAFMQTVITLEDVEHAKPHPEPVQRALVALQAEPKETIMVGDSSFDIQSAQQAGVWSAGVAWSLKGAAALTVYNPDWMLNDMRDLYDIVGLKRDIR
ncbi:MAG: pyrophosphatase PpaX [Paenibacillaceae bacterium]